MQVGQVDLVVFLQAFDQRLSLVMQVLGLELAVVGVLLLGPPFAADRLSLLNDTGSLLPARIALCHEIGQTLLGRFLVEIELSQVRGGLKLSLLADNSAFPAAGDDLLALLLFALTLAEVPCQLLM